MKKERKKASIKRARYHFSYSIWYIWGFGAGKVTSGFMGNTRPLWMGGRGQVVRFFFPLRDSLRLGRCRRLPSDPELQWVTCATAGVQLVKQETQINMGYSFVD